MILFSSSTLLNNLHRFKKIKRPVTDFHAKSCYPGRWQSSYYWNGWVNMFFYELEWINLLTQSLSFTLGIVSWGNDAHSAKAFSDYLMSDQYGSPTLCELIDFHNSRRIWKLKSEDYPSIFADAKQLQLCPQESHDLLFRHGFCSARLDGTTSFGKGFATHNFIDAKTRSHILEREHHHKLEGRLACFMYNFKIYMVLVTRLATGQAL